MNHVSKLLYVSFCALLLMLLPAQSSYSCDDCCCCCECCCETDDEGTPCPSDGNAVPSSRKTDGTHPQPTHTLTPQPAAVPFYYSTGSTPIILAVGATAAGEDWYYKLTWNEYRLNQSGYTAKTYYENSTGLCCGKEKSFLNPIDKKYYIKIVNGVVSPTNTCPLLPANPSTTAFDADYTSSVSKQQISGCPVPSPSCT
jgi:hypothetical protein